MNKHFPEDMLNRLRDEVLSLPPEAALPCNLSDFWLEQVAYNLEMSIGESAQTDAEAVPGHMTVPLMLVLHLLAGKTGSNTIQAPHEALFGYLEDLNMEIGIEIVNRHTEIKASSATLETIFTGRDVTVATKTCADGAGACEFPI